MNEAHYKLITIDDHPLFRQGVADLLAMDASLELIGEAADGTMGIKLAGELHPDIVLLDIDMKGISGLKTLLHLKKQFPDIRVLMLTVSDDEDDVVTALRAGADGYLLKDMEPEDTLRAIHAVAEGRLIVTDRLTQLLAEALRDDVDVRPQNIREAGLTARETEILFLIAKGNSNKQIARELNISPATVKVHVKNMLAKLKLNSRLQACAWLYQTTDEG